MRCEKKLSVVVRESVSLPRDQGKQIVQRRRSRNHSEKNHNGEEERDCLDIRKRGTRIFGSQVQMLYGGTNGVVTDLGRETKATLSPLRTWQTPD